MYRSTKEFAHTILPMGREVQIQVQAWLQTQYSLSLNYSIFSNSYGIFSSILQLLAYSVCKFLEDRANILFLFMTLVYTRTVSGIDQVLKRVFLNTWLQVPILLVSIFSLHQNASFLTEIKLSSTRSSLTICSWGKAEGIWGNCILAALSGVSRKNNV